MTDEPLTPHERIFASIRGLMVELDSTPGWKEWRRAKVAYTLRHDEPDAAKWRDLVPEEFMFPPDLEKRHAVLIAYLELAEGVGALKDCEFYFRRFPFRGLPLSRKTHLTYACEMFFNRFYEIRSRIKNALNSVNVLIAPRKVDVGAFLKLYDKTFDAELRARNSTHHHDRFADVTIDRLFLTETVGLAEDASPSLRNAQRQEYRALAKWWVDRVRKKSKTMQQFLDAVANAIEDSFAMPKATMEEAGASLARDISATLGPDSLAAKGFGAD